MALAPQGPWPRRAATAILVAGWAAMLAWSAPGQLSYDSIIQLGDGRSGDYDSWHPPVMAWLLGLSDRLLPGTFLFLVFMSGLALAALLWLLWLPAARGRRPGWGAATMALAIVLTPQWLLYQSDIWKDVLFADAALAGFAALAQAAAAWRRRWAWLGASALLLALAASVRQNGAVLLPVAAATLGAIAARHETRRLALVYGTAFLLLSGATSFTANAVLTAQGDEGEGARAELRSALGYDLAGALKTEPSLALPLLHQSAPVLEAALRRRGARLYSLQRLDAVMDDPAIADAIGRAPEGALFAQWRSLVLTHPLVYLRMRWPVFWQVLATPDLAACHPVYVGVGGPADGMKALGIKPRWNARDGALAQYAGAFVGTPLFSHLAFALLAAALMILLLRRRQPADLAVAGLLAGALAFTFTFLAVSLACDYRYLYFLDLAALAAAFHAARDITFLNRTGLKGMD